MSKYEKYLVHFIFFYTCIEGLVINIQFPSKLPHLYKDILIFILYLLVFLRSPKRFIPRSSSTRNLMLALSCFALVTLLFIIFPWTKFLPGLVAIKQRLFYIPLIFIGYQFVSNEADLKKLLQWQVVYAIGVSLFGVYLFFAGPTGLTRLGANYSAVIFSAQTEARASVFWRVPGTFNSPGQYGVYLFSIGLFAIALLMTKTVSKKWKLIALTSLLVIIVAIFTSGSRSPIVFLTASAAVLLLFSRKLKRVITWGLVGYTIVAIGFNILGGGVKERFGSIASYEHIERFQNTYFGQLFLPSLVKNPFGEGLGIATIGARHLSEIKPTPKIGAPTVESEVSFKLVESYFGIIATETGFPGLFAFFWVSGLIIVLIFKQRKYMRQSPHSIFWYAFAVYVLFTVLIFPVSTSIEHAPTNLYFWFLIGAIASMADIERRKRMEQQIAVRPPIAYEPSLRFS